jgi:carotenoid cleavage dioxygenase
VNTENTNIDSLSMAGRRPKTWNGEDCKAAFDRARSIKPWTLAYASCNEDSLHVLQIPLEGRIPDGLRGTFYRNGPARHERGQQRYGHRWDGDGMVRAFRFGHQVSHQGRFIQTAKYLAETAANRFLTDAFGTNLSGRSLPDDIDEMNAANISVCMSGGELLALWDPGSAYRLDPDSLDTLGLKTWSPELRGQPFSAHPKREPDGTLWNFGANPVIGELTLYCIGKDGALKFSKTLQISGLPMLHDFAITANHLVFVMSPIVLNKDRLQSGLSVGQACEWKPALGTRVLTISKIDWSQRWYELPAGCVLHVANAWEDCSGVIRLQFMNAQDPIAAGAGWAAMYGEYAHRVGACMTLAELDPRSGAKQVSIPEIEGEFPVIDPDFVGRRQREVLCVGRSDSRDPTVPGFDEIVSFDVESGVAKRFSYGKDWLVEEHVFAPGGSGKSEWIVGTALNMTRRQTMVSVFPASSISDGPVAQASLPYALPLGLHGCFVPNSGA